MSSVQVLIALAVTIGIAVALTIVLAVAGAIFRRDPARAAKTFSFTIPAQRPVQPDDAPTRDLVPR